MEKKALFLPGLGASALVWEDLLKLLPLEKRVFVLDRQDSRGAMAAAVAKEIDKPCVLVGHSMGGWVAQEVAARYPKLVDSLVLISTWSKQDLAAYGQLKMAYAAATSNQLEAMLQSHLQRIVHPKRLQEERFMQRIQEMHTALSPQTLMMQMHAMLQDFDSSSLTKQIACPVLIIHGRQDALFAYQSQERSWPGKQLVILEECGHMPPVEKTQEVATLMRDFL